jgi:hypothetical protein
VTSCATAPPPPEKPPAPKMISVAVIEFGDRKEAENGCIIAVMDAGHRVVDKKQVASALGPSGDIDYQKLGQSVGADLIIDGGVTPGGPTLPARIISSQSGNVLAAMPAKRRIERGNKSYQTGKQICGELLSQLP